jgi:hypothetical protein
VKTLLLFPLLLTLFVPPQNPQTSPADSSQVAVLSFKWIKSRQTIDTPPNERATPTREVLSINKNYQRNVRVNDPVGARDPNDDTIDGRSAALEKNVQTARTPPAKTVDAFSYLAKIHNASKQTIEIVFWEYQFVDPANPGNVMRRQFLCGVNVKPDKDKELQAFSLSGPTDVVSVGTLANKTDNTYKENALINRVEFADGTIWQRKGWNFGEIKLTYQRAVAAPWSPNEMCRGL